MFSQKYCLLKKVYNVWDLCKVNNHQADLTDLALVSVIFTLNKFYTMVVAWYFWLFLFFISLISTQAQLSAQSKQAPTKKHLLLYKNPGCFIGQWR